MPPLFAALAVFFLLDTHPSFDQPCALDARGCAALFVGFPATMADPDFPCPCIIGYDSSPSLPVPSVHS